MLDASQEDEAAFMIQCQSERNGDRLLLNRHHATPGGSILSPGRFDS